MRQSDTHASDAQRIDGKPSISIFLAGIIQGSIKDDAIHDQDYRHRLRGILEEHIPEATLYCPIENHPNSLAYSEELGRSVFFDLMGRSGASDVVIAFVPEASMGTAIEMWLSSTAGHVVVAVSPLRENWVVRFLADHVCDDLTAFEDYVRSGGLRNLISQKLGK